MIYTVREAKALAMSATDDYGEPNEFVVLNGMNKCWWSGVRYGVGLAFTPGLLLLAIGWLA